MYAFGRDRGQRPIVVMRIRDLIDAGLDENTFIPLDDTVLGYVTMNGMVPGRVE